MQTSVIRLESQMTEDWWSNSNLCIWTFDSSNWGWVAQGRNIFKLHNGVNWVFGRNEWLCNSTRYTTLRSKKDTIRRLLFTFKWLGFFIAHSTYSLYMFSPTNILFSIIHYPLSKAKLGRIKSRVLLAWNFFVHRSRSGEGFVHNIS